MDSGLGSAGRVAKNYVSRMEIHLKIGGHSALPPMHSGLESAGRVTKNYVNRMDILSVDNYTRVQRVQALTPGVKSSVTRARPRLAESTVPKGGPSSKI